MQTRIFFLIVASVAFLLPPHDARANSLREIRALSFGVFSLQGTGGATLEIDPDGNAPPPTGSIVRFRRGYNAVYEITDLPPNTSFTTSIADTMLTGSSGAPAFDVIDFKVIPDNADTPQADAAGNATLQIGATLSARAGTSYPAGAYRGAYDLMLSFF